MRAIMIGFEIVLGLGLVALVITILIRHKDSR